MFLLILAVVPSAVLFYVIWRHDKNEKEPAGLLIRLFVLGALSIIPAVLAEEFLEMINLELFTEGSYVYIFVDNFIGTALVEEGVKYFFLKKSTWKNPNFNYTFDAVVYAVVVSLGFATIENILYVIDDELSTAIARAIFSVPGHVIDAVFMGYYYGKARLAAERTRERRRNLRLALLVPVMMHGVYDFCLSAEDEIFILVFLLFEIVITVLAVRRVRKLSREDRAITGEEEQAAEPAEDYGA